MNLKNARALRAIIALDALTCAVMAALLIVGASILSELLTIPVGLLMGAGGILVPVALFMAFVAGCRSPPRWAVWIVILGNVGWIIASVAIVAGQIVDLSKFGVAFILCQAAVVSVLAAAEYKVFMRESGSMKTLA